MELRCPYCGGKRKFLPRNTRNLSKKRVQCFFCGKYFTVKQGLEVKA